MQNITSNVVVYKHKINCQFYDPLLKMFDLCNNKNKVNENWIDLKYNSIL